MNRLEELFDVYLLRRRSKASRALGIVLPLVAFALVIFLAKRDLVEKIGLNRFSPYILALAIILVWYSILCRNVDIKEEALLSSGDVRKKGNKSSCQSCTLSPRLKIMLFGIVLSNMVGALLVFVNDRLLGPGQQWTWQDIAFFFLVLNIMMVAWWWVESGKIKPNVQPDNAKTITENEEEELEPQVVSRESSSDIDLLKTQAEDRVVERPGAINDDNRQTEKTKTNRQLIVGLSGLEKGGEGNCCLNGK